MPKYLLMYHYPESNPETSLPLCGDLEKSIRNFPNDISRSFFLKIPNGNDMHQFNVSKIEQVPDRDYQIAYIYRTDLSKGDYIVGDGMRAAFGAKDDQLNFAEKMAIYGI